MRPVPLHPLPGQESVWDYPRPAVAAPTAKRVRIIHRGVLLADTVRAVRTLETSHPPSYYIPPDDIDMTRLRRTERRSLCEWKGGAVYFDVAIGGEVLPDVGWSYPDPTAPFAVLRDHVAFYAAPFDECTVDGERVVPQPGGFYGGWITSDLAGPFKGVPGSRFW
ncbi:DUF427 domain-containing protein [Aureimonas leprariae]|uniref:DUF427 domain-containing protein n=1 Tax=Plantimonas leprariae TaxID=2615207 RepID=A0A7V7PLW2_9HYPH|nr:DUF427 domain-containing protein [Aureimonas leprariae]KAB0677567.1 DUF427 domain-containing protein [Aureimonas leprariae]